MQELADKPWQMDDYRIPATPAMVEIAVADIRKPKESGLALISRLIQIDRLIEGDPEARVVMLVNTDSLNQVIRKQGELDAAFAAVADDSDELLELARPAGYSQNSRQPQAPRQGRQVFQPSLEKVLWDHTRQALARHRGNRKATARALGITDDTLRRRLALRSPAR